MGLGGPRCGYVPDVDNAPALETPPTLSILWLDRCRRLGRYLVWDGHAYYRVCGKHLRWLGNDVVHYPTLRKAS